MSGWRKRQVIEMARKAGFEQVGHDSFQEFTARVEAFAALVRADERKALCKLMEDQNTWDFYDPNRTAIEIIRARGQA